MSSPTQNPDLKAIQAAFKRHLMLQDNDIVDHVVDSDRLASRDRLAIYGNAYYARLMEALEQDYETLHVLLGDEEFIRLCENYITSFPSKHPSLRWYGQHMADFLTDQQPYRDHPYLAELACFEWTFTLAFDAADAPSATEATAAAVPPDRWPNLTFSLHPSVHWFGYHWNILPVWRAAKDDDVMPEITRLESQEYCIVWRHQLTTQFRTLDADEVSMMKGIQARENFAQLCERLALQGVDAGEVPMRAAGIMKTWLASGMVSQLDY
jgi:hypothetical protein